MSEQMTSVDESASPVPSDSGIKKKRIDTYFKTVAAVNGSDIHIKADAIPRVRVNGELKVLKTDPLSPPEIDAMVEEMLDKEQLLAYHQHGTLDLAYAMTKTERFRVNVF